MVNDVKSDSYAGLLMLNRNSPAGKLSIGFVHQGPLVTSSDPFFESASLRKNLFRRIDFPVGAINAHAQHLHQYTLSIWDVCHLRHKHIFKVHRIWLPRGDCYCFHCMPSLSAFYQSVSYVSCFDTVEDTSLMPDFKPYACLFPPHILQWSCNTSIRYRWQ